MNINRNFYLEQLKLREKNGMVKILTGVRRCGKSYLLLKIFVDYLLSQSIKSDHIIQLTLDGIENEKYREPHTLYDFIESQIKDNDTYYILLDEIQFVNRFTEVLNSLLRIDNLDIYVTGSNSKFLSSDILTEFRGRGDEIRLYPLSFSEFFSVYEGNEEAAFFDYLTFGGLPKIPSLKTDEQKIKYLTDLFAETYLKDIVERNKIKNVKELDELVNVLASNIGSLVNPTKLSNTFKSVSKVNITDKTIKNYIDYLKDAFLIEPAIRFDIKGKKYINSPFKIYFVDSGLRNARIGFRQIEETHLMENIIYTELKRRGYLVDVGEIETREISLSGKNERKHLEVDFIAYKGNNKYYIQSAFAIPSSEKKEQEIRPLLHINDSFKKIVVVGQYMKLKRDENGITMMNIREFLLNENSLDL